MKQQLFKKVLVFTIIFTLLPVFAAQGAEIEQPWDLARVISVEDGDTIKVRLEKDKSVRNIRLIGIQAFEGKTDKNLAAACGAKQATKELKRLLKKGNWVQLRSVKSDSKNRGRLFRSVFKADKNGNYTINIQTELLRNGFVLWLPDKVENANNEINRLAMQEAIDNRKNIWSGKLCKKSKIQNILLGLAINHDAPGDDNFNVNGEYVLIENGSSIAVNLEGWTLRDTSQRSFKFPKNTIIQPGQRITVKAGVGDNTSTEFFMNSPTPMFENIDKLNGVGDGAYLLDEYGNLRFWSIYY
ncbi:MAG: lamin tail domain-containing protein [Actinomycetes bacterium]